MDDFELAKRLQEEEFSGSYEKISPAKASRFKKNKENKPSSMPSSLADPSWELIDPNPNIFSLFQAFDKKYFWSALESVEVKWSPRMTSCAGICTYKGKRGGCVISLSLPLLKLRPRKDLVETLLHEMIHAYLFLTANDRDRDGHGPQFHYHMYRINAEAGTKISVYHSFHDEVRHYKNHWWRCDGPCRSRHPFYGIVKRAMNRPPGPNDPWFAGHQASCGGTFIKIQEPEGFKSKNKKAEVTNKSPDIRKYLIGANPSPPRSPIAGAKHPSTTGNKNVPGQVNGTKKLFPSVPKDNTSTKNGRITKHKGQQGNPVRNLFNYFPKPSSSRPSSVVNSTENNVHGFQKSASSTTSKISGSANVHGFGSSSVGGFRGGLKSNMGGTLVQNPKVLGKEKADDLADQKTDVTRKAVVPFAGTGYVLAAPGSVVDRSRSKLLSLCPPQAKKPKVEISPDKQESQISVVSASTKVPCPSCGESVEEVIVNKHLDSCLKMDFDDHIDDKNLPPSPSKSLFANCPICGKSVYKTKINEHVSDCLNNDPFMDLTREPVLDTSAPSTSSSTSSFPESTSSPKALFANCPVCDKKVYKTKMDEHLDACVRLDSIMDSSGYEIVELDDEGEKETSQVQCPCCDHTFTPDTINLHLDSCLQTLDFE